MLWTAISLFFCWLIYRELRRKHTPRIGFDAPDTSPVYKPYVALLLVLALATAAPPLNSWRMGRLFGAVATQLAEGRPAKVHCNTIFDTWFDQHVFAAAYANFDTGEIVVQYPWCRRIMDYRSHPERASPSALHSLHLLTHESMHVRGERNEAITECQALQRNFRTARLLGVTERTARQNAADLYSRYRQRQLTAVGMQLPYFSEDCAPGRALDERLADPPWGSP